MFKENTVLILGAGATADIGYPTGEELINDILQIDYALVKEKIPEKDFIDFRNRIIQIRPIMIDAFLSHNPIFEDVGRALIAYTILKKENENIFKMQKIPEKENGSGWDNWYRYLSDSITQGCYDRQSLFKNNDNLNIITFNYDISLEYYLHSRLKQISLFQEYIDDFLKDINIIHVYGQLGCFEWHKKYCDKMYDYDKDLKIPVRWEGYGYGSGRQLYNELSKSIQIIGSNKWGNNSPNHIKQIRSIIQSANKIYILGFGFYSENIRLINLDEAFKSNHIRKFYTNYGDHKIIDRKIYQMAEYQQITSFKINEEKNSIIESNLIKSTKRVFQAVSEDFDFLE